MNTVLQLVFSGIAMGFVYALCALGIVLIYSSAGVVNFAQGSLVMLGAYIGVTFLTKAGLPVIWSVICSAIIMGFVGILFERIAYYPLRDQGTTIVIISTIGVSVFLNDGVYVLWGRAPLFFPPLLGGPPLELLGARIPPQNIAIAAITMALLLFQTVFFKRTWLGRKMRAVAQDQDTAALMGIKVPRMIDFTFAYSTILAAIAGIFAAPLFFVSPAIAQILSKAFASTVVGGFGSIPGAIIGGLCVGLTETFAAYYLSSAYRDAWAFLLLILFLLVRPQGIFGEIVAEKV
ncbi:MAG: branched-chain amino acid ABC transporter permease [Limnochordia bacterium]|nr:branched-chain amino acid ABC transporter permease [Bacillota bacterium]